MNALEKKIKTQIFKFLENETHSLKEYTPGLCLQIYSKNQLKADLKMGLTYQYYDLASLTKVIFTVPQIIKILKNKNSKLKLSTPINAILSWWPTHSKITLKHLLTHTSGLPWWRPIYKECPQDLIFSTPLETKNTSSKAVQFLKKKFLSFKKKKIGKCVYSDPGFWLLGWIIEEIEEKFLSEIWEESPMASEIYFHPKNIPPFAKNAYAPTGFCEWRKKMLCGEVHDRNAWAFGGVAPHAGLFSSIQGVSHWALRLRKKYHSKGSSLIKTFTKKANLDSESEWGLGFMKPKNPMGGAGKFFSPSSFGHTGFSGVSFWFDPKKDLLIILLSNRTADLKNNSKDSFELLSKKPTRKNKKSKAKEYDINIYETFETKRIQRTQKIPFSNLRKEIHNIILKTV